MPTVTITLTDTPTGGVAVRTDYQPAIGNPCSMAQAAALDIIRRTCKEYGATASAPAVPTSIGDYARKKHELPSKTQEPT